MATNHEIEAAVAECLAAAGVWQNRECMPLSDLAGIMQGMVTGETQQSLEQKIQAMAKSPKSLLEATNGMVCFAEQKLAEGE